MIIKKETKRTVEKCLTLQQRAKSVFVKTAVWSGASSSLASIAIIGSKFDGSSLGQSFRFNLLRQELVQVFVLLYHVSQAESRLLR